jgi:vitamin B12 transport system permease protein
MTRRRRVFANAFAAISAAMLGLAAGALWMLPTAYLRSSLPWLAVPLGALLGWAIAHWVLPRPGAALLAALATLLAAAYVSVLIAAARLAGNMDMGLTEAMRIAGAGMLWSLVRLSLDVAQLAWFAAGAAVAAWTARRSIGR